MESFNRNTNFSQNLIDLDIRLLQNYYRSKGYRQVKVLSKTASLNNDGNADIVYSIDAGQGIEFQKLKLMLMIFLTKKYFFPLNKKYKEIIGEYYSPFAIKKLLESLDELILNNNLQFVEHNVEENLDEDNNNISIKINVFEGKKF